MKKYSIKKIIQFIQAYIIEFSQEIRLQKIQYNLVRFFCFVAIMYILSSLVTNLFCQSINDRLTPQKKEQLRFFVEAGSSPRFRDKEILERNIFNSKNDIPPEDKDDSDDLKVDISRFPCSEESLPSNLKLIGIVYTGSQATNLVTIKDSKAKTADVYKVGDSIIDYSDYEIYKISSPTSFEVRSANKKICTNLLSGKGFSRNYLNNFKSNVPDISTYDLANDFVNEQIGKGFSKILASSQMVPESSTDGSFVGFKIQGIMPNSLFDKIEVMNGDLIESVNGVSLKDVSKGFALYEALQNERQIVIKINRDGKIIIKKVYVK
ncbi:MAG: hypothetical protein K2X39_08895 [Silvanigrellaceae bacterium]|nr:hypothetical protein [Silvanigrellaceae bacterium]